MTKKTSINENIENEQFITLKDFNCFGEQFIQNKKYIIKNKYKLDNLQTLNNLEKNNFIKYLQIKK